MRTAFILCVLSGLFLGAAQSKAAASAVAPIAFQALPADSALVKALAPFSFLLGRWEGEGSGGAIKSRGRFSFEAEAQGHAIMRHNTLGPHEDVLVIYPEPGRGGAPDSCRALYVDNEGHTIHYTARASADSASAEFVSDATPGMPLFLLTYRTQADGTLRIRFAMGEPGSTVFHIYGEGVGRRVPDR